MLGNVAPELAEPALGFFPRDLFDPLYCDCGGRFFYLGTHMIGLALSTPAYFLLSETYFLLCERRIELILLYIILSYLFLLVVLALGLSPPCGDL